MGITFGNEGWRAKNVKLEAYYSSQWNTLKDVTNQTEEYVHIRHTTGSNAQTKLRWTLSNQLNINKNSFYLLLQL